MNDGRSGDETAPAIAEPTGNLDRDQSARSRRSAASRKAWRRRKASAAMDQFIAEGTAIGAMPERGTERGDYSPRELIERIRAREGR